MTRPITLIYLTLAALLLGPTAVQAESKALKESTTQIPLVKLKERASASIALTQTAKTKINLNAEVGFYDAKGRLLSMQRGLITPENPSFIATLQHDELGVLDPVHIRPVVRTTTTEPVATAAACSLAGGFDNDDGPYIAFVVGCSCGPSQGGHVSQQCRDINYFEVRK